MCGVRSMNVVGSIFLALVIAFFAGLTAEASNWSEPAVRFTQVAAFVFILSWRQGWLARSNHHESTPRRSPHRRL